MPDYSSASDSSSPIETFNSIDSLAYANCKTELRATLKQEFADFQVDEQLGFKPTEKGEHLYLRIEKTDQSTVDVAKRLSEVSGVHGSEIGYSGMKDRRAQTRQWFSIKLPPSRGAELATLESDSLHILESHRNSRKLKIGTHRSNHFRVVLRDCNGAREEFEERLRQIEHTGVPNYFGSQRFGRQLSNLAQVQAWMAAELDPTAAAVSSQAIPKQRFKRSLLFSAARSYLFNQLLSRRLELGNWNRYVTGDVLNLDGTERCFALQQSLEWDETLQRRLEQFDIHITGPLPGDVDSKDRYVSYGEAADIEDAVCKEFSTLMAGLKYFGLKAARRPLRFRPIDLSWEWRQSEGVGSAELSAEPSTELSTEPPEGPGDLILDFSLGKGVYATSLLRELCVTKEHA